MLCHLMMQAHKVLFQNRLFLFLYTAWNEVDFKYRKWFANTQMLFRVVKFTTKFHITAIPNVTLRTTEVIVFFFLTITSILVKNSWSVYFDKFYQRNKHKVIFFRYFGTLSRKCVWRYVQWRINHFASYDDIK